MRTASIQRTTNETRIALVLNLDGTGKSEICSGVGGQHEAQGVVAGLGMRGHAAQPASETVLNAVPAAGCAGQKQRAIDWPFPALAGEGSGNDPMPGPGLQIGASAQEGHAQIRARPKFFKTGGCRPVHRTQGEPGQSADFMEQLIPCLRMARRSVIQAGTGKKGGHDGHPK